MLEYHLRSLENLRYSMVLLVENIQIESDIVLHSLGSKMECAEGLISISI